MYINLIILFSGLILASFANMLIYRLPRSLSIISPRSFCTNCKKQLSSKQLLPLLGFLLSKGTCSFCRCKIPIRYILVELIIPIGFLFITHQFGLTFIAFKLAFFFYFSTILLFTDLETQLLPNSITYLITSSGLLFFTIEHLAVKAVLGLLTGFVTFYLIAVVGKLVYKKDVIGGGDIKLAAGIGAFWGTQLCIISIYVSFVLGGVAAVMLLLLKKKDRQSNIAFGPALIIGTFIALSFKDVLWTLFFPTL
jgi:leader peptidase (prepilin peptidase) / N-methyltransferase